MDRLVKIRIDESRFKALAYFIKLKDSTIEAELGKAVDLLYDKFVPKEVRSYVEGVNTEQEPEVRRTAQKKNHGSSQPAE
ncbi:MAG: hypothetical protein IJ555_02090 [Ruminococcus sp.]|nr:hypothetical protein [Ruminococcus sp.]